MKKNGTIVNIIFAAFILFYEFASDAVYSLLTGDALEETARDVIYGGKTDFLLGAVMIAAVLAEFIGIFIKSRRIPPQSGKGVLITLWIFHTAVSTIMVMTACKAFGANITKPGAVAGTVVILNIIKELAVLGLLLREPSGRSTRATDLLADACILFFYCTGFSTGWDVISATPGSNLHQYLGNVPLLALYTIAAVIFFLILYLPLRIGYFMTERIETNRDCAAKGLSIGAVLIAAMIPLYRPLDHKFIQQYWPEEYNKLHQQHDARAPGNDTTGKHRTDPIKETRP